MSDNVKESSKAPQKSQGYKGNPNRGRGRRGGDKSGRGKENQAPAPTRQRVPSEMSDGEGERCTVCLYTIDIYAVGECNHSVCYRCATRMRVLCLRNECAICRRDLPKVILSRENKMYDEVKDQILPMDQKFKICFENEEIEDEYIKLLGHECTECEDKPTFRNFLQMKRHMNINHKRFYCDLCVDNLKIFSHERKHYDKQGLSDHRVKGDKEDTSFKGHPLCEYCGIRFLDNDELFKHLRKDHYFCHFCDADGNQLFFAEYKDLRGHFKKDHFLCEEPECEEQKFIVFRTELDFKAHKLEKHSSSRSAIRQNRQVDIAFSFNRREGREERDRSDRYRDIREDPNIRQRQDRNIRDEEERQQTPEIVPDLVHDFPSLMGAAASVARDRGGTQPSVARDRGGTQPSVANDRGGGEPKQQGSDGLAKKLALSTGQNVASGGGAGGASWSGRSGGLPAGIDEFPTLPGTSGAASSSAPPPVSYKPNINKKNKPEPSKNNSSSSGGKRKPGKDEFPGLPAPSKSNKPKPVQATTRPSTAPTIKTNNTATNSKSNNKTSTNNTKSSKHRPFDPFADLSDDDFPSFGGGGGGPSGLDFSSTKAIRSSGQAMDYTSKETSSNIKTVDRSLLEALQGSRISEPSPPVKKSVQVSNRQEFPGLGSSSAPLSSVGSSSGAGKKNKKAKSGYATAATKPGNNSKQATKTNSTSSKSSSPAPKHSTIPGLAGNNQSLNSLASFLGVEPETRPVCDNPSNLSSSVPYATSISRPSKQKQPPKPAPKQEVVAAPTTMDFPSLDLKSKGLGLNFIRAEDKLVPPKPVTSQWTKKADTPPEATKVSNGITSNGSSGKSKHKSTPSPDKKKSDKIVRKENQYFTYVAPENFQERNRKLKSCLSESMGIKSLEFKMFKEISVQFQSGEMSCADYFVSCNNLIDKDLFLELLVLLPDINKQHELYAKFIKKYPDQKSQVSQCDVCRQVLLVNEMEDHFSSHDNDDDFPVLG